MLAPRELRSASLGLLGAAVGAAIILINFLSQLPVYVEPELVRETPHSC